MGQISLSFTSGNRKQSQQGTSSAYSGRQNVEKIKKKILSSFIIVLNPGPAQQNLLLHFVSNIQISEFPRLFLLCNVDSDSFLQSWFFSLPLPAG